LNVAYLDPFEGVPDRLLALLSAKPRRRALGQLYVVLDGKRDHRLPELAVVAAEELQVNNVSVSTAARTVISARWVDVETRRPILMVSQRAAAHKPCFAAERLQVCIAACDLLDRHGIANRSAASAETVGGLLWVML
jgi:hypothetical protein